MTGFVVVNPHSAGGRTARDCPNIERALRAAYPDMRHAMTQTRGSTASLVRNALQEGHHEIVAVGGDGTIAEAVNGLFDVDGPIAPDAVFGFISTGTNGDFARSFGLAPDYPAAIDRLARAPVHRIDVGRLSCLARDGKSMVRYFANIGSFGLSGAVVDAVERSRMAKLFGRRAGRAFHGACAGVAWRRRAIRLRIDHQYDEIVTISTVTVANGGFFGGFRVAPQAMPDDGLFEVIIVEEKPHLRALVQFDLIHSMTLGTPAACTLRARKIVAEPVAATRRRPVLVEVDGECVGQLPATFELLPRALNLRC